MVAFCDHRGIWEKFTPKIYEIGAKAFDLLCGFWGRTTPKAGQYRKALGLSVFQSLLTCR